jgi:predicted dinucleotide-utilizing enzyme
LRRIKILLVAGAVGALALIGAAPAHACDPNSTCNKPTDKAVCVVKTVIFFDGQVDDFVREVAGCLVRV